MKYSYEKCIKFLEDNNFKFYDEVNNKITYINLYRVMILTFPFNLKEVINVLNSGGGESVRLTRLENTIAAILRGNKDKLIEEE